MNCAVILHAVREREKLTDGPEVRRLIKSIQAFATEPEQWSKPSLFISNLSRNHRQHTLQLTQRVQRTAGEPVQSGANANNVLMEAQPIWEVSHCANNYSA